MPTKKLLNQNGAVPLLMLVAVIGLIGFLTISSTAFPKPAYAADPILITSCQEINLSGNYTLNQDIISAPDAPGSAINGWACLEVHDVGGVNIDCNGHTVTAIQNNSTSRRAIRFTNVQNFSLNNCNITVNNLIIAGIYGLPLQIINSSDGIINQNIISKDYVDVKDSQNLQITNNTFSSSYQQARTSGSLIKDNQLSVPNDIITAGVIISGRGFNNQIIHNTIDGKSNSFFDPNQKAADDGILISWEHDDLISNNTILNNWDCGIETSGFVSNSSFLDNNIKNAAYCGIGGWNSNSWLGNTVSGNVVDDSPRLFTFFRHFGLLPQEQFVYFQNNVFKNNQLINPRQTFWDSRDYNGIPTSTLIDMQNMSGPVRPEERAITPADMKVGNNSFQNNDFGTRNSAPLLFPPAMVIDEGGNICPQPSASTFPLNCQTSTPLLLPGDIDNNKKVDIFDYNLLLTDYGATSGTGLRSDINNSGKVDIFDYNILLTNFGRTTP